MKRINSIFAVIILIGVMATPMVLLPVIQAHAEPPLIDVTLEPGQSRTVTTTVNVPEVPPKLDLVLDVDLSSSYNDNLVVIKEKKSDVFEGVKKKVSDSWFGLVTFVDYPFPPWGGEGDYAYKRDQDLTSDETAWKGAVDQMYTRYGGDGLESQLESVLQVATGVGRDVNGDGDLADSVDIATGQGVSFRRDATRVVALTTDAPMHTAHDSNCEPTTSLPSPCRIRTVLRRRCQCPQEGGNQSLGHQGARLDRPDGKAGH